VDRFKERFGLNRNSRQKFPTGGKYMLLIAKAALGIGATVVLSTAYVFHEGVIRVDVDERGEQGSHVHFWVPAVAVPIGMQLAPRRALDDAAGKVRPYLPALKALAKEMEKYPNAEFVDVQDASKHVRVSTASGRLQVDVVDEGETVHVAVPVAAIRDMEERLEERSPGL
jgi:hypothetical protein